ncbi:MAG: tetratricopeptide repeat protein [Ignavibacteria bacterium]|nr:tetratricopeptide repeat protein [Ignavibacteria bacterium]MBK7034451.1 tetratricopeptide repeat protein [Ignavibacteria bacterium]MBK7578470.1 tetratricopeptide repeat protein [Ignavibacteria bacterium]
MIRSRTISPLILLIIAVGTQGCAWFDNQTTYFNTYYNMRRIMTEVKDEFDFQDENKRNKPRVLVPAMDSMRLVGGPPKNATYQFLRAFVIERAKLQPVATKVDSILIKGSKVVANHPKSDYIQGSLYLMAEAYFIRSEWVPSQQKCIELVERFADGDYSPDAHLLLAKDYLMQRKMTQGKQALSRAVDVAWYKDRYDILSEAYRIQAEMAIEDGQIDKAVNPYKQAVAQCEDGEQRARWQVDVGSIYYRLGEYALAEAAFRKVFDETPDALAEFEALLYGGSCLVRLGKYDEAQKIFDDLDANKNFSEWTSYIEAERLALDRLRSENPKDPAVIARERQADTSFVGRPEMMAQSFQKGMGLYKTGNYNEALKYFAKAKVVRTPVYDVANKYFTLLKQWDDQHKKIRSIDQALVIDTTYKDSLIQRRSVEFFTLGRIFEQLEQHDSALVYYNYAYDSTSANDPARGRYLFSQARLIRDTDPDRADSLFEIVAERWPKSEFAREASANLGFSSEGGIDDAAELYRSGNSFRLVKDYGYASRQYMAIVEKFPENEYAPKALYAMGWMYERDRNMNDSALYYYGLLLERYPRSQYAKEIHASVEYALAKANGVEITDSTLFRDLDQELLDKAKAGEQNVLQQLIKNNQDALQVTGPNVTLPNIPGLAPNGGSVNDLLQQQLKNAQGVVPGSTTDSTRVAPPPKKP